jgi:hypothetical protein
MDVAEGGRIGWPFTIPFFSEGRGHPPVVPSRAFPRLRSPNGVAANKKSVAIGDYPVATLERKLILPPTALAERLFNKQHFLIGGQRPQVVGHPALQLVGVLADHRHSRQHVAGAVFGRI